MNSFVSSYFEIPCLASLLAFSIYTLFCFKRLSFRANKAPLFSVMSSNWAPNVRDTRSRITMAIIIPTSVLSQPQKVPDFLPHQSCLFSVVSSMIYVGIVIYIWLLNYWAAPPSFLWHKLPLNVSLPLLSLCYLYFFVTEPSQWYFMIHKCRLFFFELNSALKFFLTFGNFLGLCILNKSGFKSTGKF